MEKIKKQLARLRKPKTKKQERCRHARGVIWYVTNPEALEPDMHCKTCGLDLG